jgi:hypothetical protein
MSTTATPATATQATTQAEMYESQTKAFTALLFIFVVGGGDIDKVQAALQEYSKQLSVTTLCGAHAALQTPRYTSLSEPGVISETASAAAGMTVKLLIAAFEKLSSCKPRQGQEDISASQTRFMASVIEFLDAVEFGKRHEPEAAFEDMSAFLGALRPQEYGESFAQVSTDLQRNLTQILGDA